DSRQPAPRPLPCLTSRGATSKVTTVKVARDSRTGEGMDPAGKTAVVTGGNSGLGEATVKALLAAGARVVSLDLAGEAPQGASSIACDVSDAASVEAAVARIDGPIHILVNSAGIGGMG